MPALCDRCGERRASGQSSTTTVTPDGIQTNVTESLCAVCAATDRAAFEVTAEAGRAQMSAELADGSFYERLRAELAPVVKAGDREQLANASVFLDRVREALGVPFPEDLERFANQHRPPAA